MEIVRERFLDTTKQYHLSLSLRSRTTEMHSVLSALSADERDAVGSVLARALDDIGHTIARALERERDRIERPTPLTG